tara:strand:- start:855 stop:1091 length:237 start_codon:yes stop_codon:yes gene_type:complete
MIRSIEEKPRGPTPIEIDLNGPKGNAFYLLGLAQDLSKKMGHDKARTERILEEMKLYNYECLLNTFDREFGMLVTLWR